MILPYSGRQKSRVDVPDRDGTGKTPALPRYLIRVTRSVAVSKPSTDRRRIS